MRTLILTCIVFTCIVFGSVANAGELKGHTPTRIPVAAGTLVRQLDAFGGASQEVIAAAGDYYSNGFLFNSANEVVMECRLGCSGGGSSLAPLTGGSNANAFAANQMVLIGASNGTTSDSLRETGGALWTAGSAGGAYDTPQNSSAPANVLADACAYNSTTPSIAAGNLDNLQCDPQGHLTINPHFGYVSYQINDSATTGYQIGPNGAASKLMYVDGTLIANGATNVSLGYGSGNCTAQTTTFGPTALVPQVGYTFSLIIPAGDYLCMALSAAVQVGGGANILQE